MLTIPEALQHLNNHFLANEEITEQDVLSKILEHKLKTFLQFPKGSSFVFSAPCQDLETDWLHEKNLVSSFDLKQLTQNPNNLIECGNSYHLSANGYRWAVDQAVRMYLKTASRPSPTEGLSSETICADLETEAAIKPPANHSIHTLQSDKTYELAKCGAFRDLAHDGAWPDSAHVNHYRANVLIIKESENSYGAACDAQGNFSVEFPKASDLRLEIGTLEQVFFGSIEKSAEQRINAKTKNRYLSLIRILAELPRLDPKQAKGFPAALATLTTEFECPLSEDFIRRTFKEAYGLNEIHLPEERLQEITKRQLDHFTKTTL